MAELYGVPTVAVVAVAHFAVRTTVQVSDPLSVAESPPSAVALAAGLGCGWQALFGVVAGLETVIVTEPCAAMAPSEQFSVLLVIEQLPCVVEPRSRVRPPLVGRASVNITLV